MNYWSYDYAEAEFKKVIEHNLKRRSSQRLKDLHALSHCGLVSTSAQKMYKEKDKSEEYFNNASKHYAEAIAICSGNPQIEAIAHISMGMVLANYGQLDDASEIYKKSVQLMPNHWRTYIHWGRALIVSKEYEDAANCFKQAIALNPGYEFAHYQLGIAYKHLGVTLKQDKKYDQALDSFSKAPNIAQAYDERGQILAEPRNQYQAALDEFEKAISLKSDLSNAMVNYAWFALEGNFPGKKYLDKAIDYAKKAVEIDKNSSNLWHRHSVLGRVYLALDQLENAKIELEKSIGLNKNGVQSYYFLGKVQFEKGMLAEARKSLTEFLNRSRNSNWYIRTRPLAIELMKKIDDGLCIGEDQNSEETAR